MKRILILGVRGTLGSQLQRLYPGAIGWDREDVDVTDFPALRAKVSSVEPEAIVNCVAFNDVDGAEERSAAAYTLNAEYPGMLAAFTRRLRIPLVHYSTNYVFDGKQGEYREEDRPSPLSVYGKSKYLGEQLVAENAGEWYLVRTAVLFGPKGPSDLSKKSFVELMLGLAEKRDHIQAVDDEVNSVTYAPDLAIATGRLLDARPCSGIYHVSNSGAVSWYEFAREIFRIAGKPVTVSPVPSSHFPRKAVRPSKAILLNTKLPPLRPWTEALAQFVDGETATSARKL